jgi:hypothetical protein
MKLRKAERRQAKIKAAIQGPSGSGKTYSALLLAEGLTTTWDRIALVDTEHGSADLYAHLGPYNVIPMQPPFSPERYIKAIELAQKQGMEVLILDTISPCWDYLLDYHSKLQGNSFANWSKVTPLHKALIEAILQADMHVIATMRVKQDYVLNEKDGKHVPEKVGLKAIQRDGVDYEFTVVFDIDPSHMVSASKDRTGLFMDQPAFTVTKETGRIVQEWCQQGVTVEEVRYMIQDCETIEELRDLFYRYRSMYEPLASEFKASKQKILNPSNIKNDQQNGSVSNQ